MINNKSIEIIEKIDNLKRQADSEKRERQRNKKFYLTSYNTKQNYGHKMPFDTREEAEKEFHRARKLPLKHMYHFITKGQNDENIILDSRTFDDNREI